MEIRTPLLKNLQSLAETKSHFPSPLVPRPDLEARAPVEALTVAQYPELDIFEILGLNLSYWPCFALTPSGTTFHPYILTLARGLLPS